MLFKLKSVLYPPDATAINRRRKISRFFLEGGEQVFGSTDLALKRAWIVDLCCKSSGFADFENTADGGSAVIFDADSGLCLSYVRTLGPERNLDHKSFFSLDRHVNEFIQIISFFERSSFQLGCETVIGIVLCCCHQARCLLYYFGKINSGIHMFQFTFEPLHLYFRMWLWFRI